MSNYQQPYGQQPYGQQPQYQQNPQYQQQPQYQQPYGQQPFGNPYDPKTYGYYEMITHILLCLFTGGIWNLIWIYRTTRYLNCLPDEEYRNPATKLLLCMFVPFYSIYWIYKSAQRIDKLAKQNGIVSDLAVVCLILEIFVSLIPPILMQDKINKIVGSQQ